MVGGSPVFRLFVAVNRPNNRAVILLGFLALKPQFHPSLACARVFVAKHNAILRRHTVSKCWCAAMCA